MKKPRLRVTKADAAWLLLTALVVVLQFWWLPGDGGSTADSFSNALEGSRGLYETLTALSDKGHLPPVRRETTQLIPSTPGVLMMIAPDRYPDDYEQEELLKYVQNGGTVILAANWTVPNRVYEDCDIPTLRCRLTWKHTRPGVVAPSVSGTGTIRSAGTEATENDAVTSMPSEGSQVPDAADRSDQDAATAIDTVPSDDPLDLPEIQTTNTLIEGDIPWRSTAYISRVPTRAERLVVDADGDVQLAAWRAGQGTFILCASADPFSNRSMLFPRQVEFAVRLTEFACSRTGNRGDIIVSEYLNGAGSYTGASVMVSPMLRAGTLQLILVAVLLAWSGFHRFGPPLRERRHWRRSQAESAEAVGNLQFMANDGVTSVRQYFDWFCGEIRRRYGHTQILSDPQLLARQTGLDENQVIRALDDAEDLSKQQSVAPAEAAAAIRRLARIHQRMFQSGQPSSRNHS